MPDCHAENTCKPFQSVQLNERCGYLYEYGSLRAVHYNCHGELNAPYYN